MFDAHGHEDFRPETMLLSKSYAFESRPSKLCKEPLARPSATFHFRGLEYLLHRCSNRGHLWKSFEHLRPEKAWLVPVCPVWSKLPIRVIWVKWVRVLVLPLARLLPLSRFLKTRFRRLGAFKVTFAAVAEAGAIYVLALGTVVNAETWRTGV